MELSQEPSFKVKFEDFKCRRFNNLCIERNINCIIYYFFHEVKSGADSEISRKYEAELMKIMQIIEIAFIDGFSVNESFFVSIEEIESVIEENVLICSFNIHLVEEIESILNDLENDEFMNELNIN